MAFGPEFRLAEKPCIEGLINLGYKYLRPAESKEAVKLASGHLREGDNAAVRDSQNQVLRRDELIDAVQRINGVTAEVARATYQINQGHFPFLKLNISIFCGAFFFACEKVT
jgi:hypothetical protein